MDKKFVWVVRTNEDQTEGRGRTIDVSIHDTEEEAFEANRNISGVMGYPSHFGGEIWKITLGTYPINQEMVFGHRKNWEGVWNQGWVDWRDKPSDDDPDWIEFKRLRDKFYPDSTNLGE